MDYALQRLTYLMAAVFVVSQLMALYLIVGSTHPVLTIVGWCIVAYNTVSVTGLARDSIAHRDEYDM